MRLRVHRERSLAVCCYITRYPLRDMTQFGVVWPHKSGNGFDVVLYEGISIHDRIVCTEAKERSWSPYRHSRTSRAGAEHHSRDKAPDRAFCRPADFSMEVSHHE